MELKKKHSAQKTKIVAGNTSAGIFGKQWDEAFEVKIDINGISELISTSASESGIEAGALTTITQLLRLLKDNISSSSSIFPSLIKHMERIAGNGVRGSASFAGNLSMAKNLNFPSDLAIIMWGAGALLTVVDLEMKSSQITVEDFVKSKDDLFIKSIFVPFGKPNEHLFTYRAALRKVNSHPLLNSAFRVVFDKQTVSDITIVYGATGNGTKTPHCFRATETEKLIKDHNLDASVFANALSSMYDLFFVALFLNHI